MQTGPPPDYTVSIPGNTEENLPGNRFTTFICKCHPLMDMITSTMCIAMTWIVIYMFFNMKLHSDLVSVMLLLTCSWTCGKIAGILYLPPLLGMLLAGMAIQNTGLYDSQHNKFQLYLNNFREVALAILLVACGISLDASMLKKLKFVVFQLAILPCITETIAVAIIAYFLIGLPWIWGILLGCVLSPVSSAVILPSLLNYKQKGLGEDKGIITLVMAACSFDDIFCISAFGVCLSIIFSEGTWLANTMQGPIEIVIGIGVGIVCGIFIGFIPHKCERNLTYKRAYVLTIGGVLLTFGSKMIDYPGAGPLATMIAAFVAANCWITIKSFSEDIENIANIIWDLLEPLLFASIGTEIDLLILKPSLIISSLILLTVTMLVRAVTCFFVLMNTDFNLHEKIFINIAWSPKATVQAAIGPIALDIARRRDVNLIPYASDVLAVSVLAILFTATLGSISMKLCGEYLLRKQY